MKFVLTFSLLMSFSAFAKTKNVSLLTVAETEDLCPQLGNWSGFYTRDRAFSIECTAPQAKIMFNAFRTSPFTQITRSRYAISALITDASETYDMINSVGTVWRGRTIEIVCKPKHPGSHFADWCRVTKFLRR
jgi:hypothetical protein